MIAALRRALARSRRVDRDMPVIVAVISDHCVGVSTKADPAKVHYLTVASSVFGPADLGRPLKLFQEA